MKRGTVSCPRGKIVSAIAFCLLAALGGAGRGPGRAVGAALPRAPGHRALAVPGDRERGWAQGGCAGKGQLTGNRGC